jgi:hypothetical protein
MSKLIQSKEELISKFELELSKHGFSRLSKELIFTRDRDEATHAIWLHFHYRSGHYNITAKNYVRHTKLEELLYGLLNKKTPDNLDATIGDYIESKGRTQWILNGENSEQVFADLLSVIENALIYFEKKSSLKEILFELRKHSKNNSNYAQKAITAAFLLQSKEAFEDIIKITIDKLGWIAQSKETRYEARRKAYEEFQTLASLIRMETNW